METSGTDHGVRSEDNVVVIVEVRGLLGVELTNVQRKLNAPLLHCLLDAGFSTQHVAGVSEDNPAVVE